MANVENTSGQLLTLGTPLQAGRYIVSRYLASGGFGNTYIADDTLFETRVVIKEFYLRGVSTRHGNGRTVSVSLSENRPIWTKMLDKFKREARHMYKFNHPNIVRVHDFFEENGTAYYVMDLVEGRSLRDIVAEGGPMSERQVLALVPQILSALERIHSENIYHLDLKPANVMLERGEVVRLIDFGASKQNTAESGMTISTLAYTPAYASPEQTLQNVKSIGAWSDLYSLGATIYHLLTRQEPPGQVLFNDEGAAAFKWQLFNVSPAMQRFVMTLMSPRRSDRPQNVEQARRLLASLMGGGAQPVAPPSPVVPPVAKRQVGVPTRNRPAAAMQPQPEVARTVERPQPAPAQQPEMSEAEALRRRINASRQKPAKKSNTPLVVSLVAVAAIIIGVAVFFLSGGSDDNATDQVTTESLYTGDSVPESVETTYSAPTSSAVVDSATDVPMNTVDSAYAAKPSPARTVAKKKSYNSAKTQNYNNDTKKEDNLKPMYDKPAYHRREILKKQ